MAAIPDDSACTTGRLNERDVQAIDRVRVTMPLRTLIDVIAEGVIAPELTPRPSTRRSGAVWSCDGKLETARVSTRARQRIDRILKQAPGGSSRPVRNRRRVLNRTRGADQRTVAS